MVVFLLIAVFLSALGGSIYGYHIYDSGLDDTPISLSVAGKQVFDTQEEWGAFKRFIGQDDVRIDHLKEYSSDPPIVAEYWLTMPPDTDFPYNGERYIEVVGAEEWRYNDLCFGMTCAPFGLAFILVFFWMVGDLYFGHRQESSERLGNISLNSHRSPN